MFKFQVKNIGAKIVALVVATVLWVYVTNEQNPQIEAIFNIPLEVRNLPAAFSVNDVPRTVKVKVRGSRSYIAGDLPKSIKAYIDLGGLTEGVNNVKTNVEVPGGLELIETNPDKISIQLDSSAVEQISLEVRFIGVPGQGVSLQKSHSRPTQITVSGAKTLIKNIDRAAVTIDITGRTGDFSAEVPVQLIVRDGKKAEKVSIIPEKVTIYCTFGQDVTKKLTDIKPLINQLPAIKVGITGTRENIDKVEYVFTESVNLATITKDTVIEVKLQSKEGMILS